MRLSTLAATLAIASAALPAAAHIVVYQGQLLGTSEVPSVTTTGHGFAKVTFDMDLVTMRVQVSFADLVGSVTASHIHCCVAPGANVGVATVTPTFTGFPTGTSQVPVRSGTYDHTFDMSLASSYNTNPTTGFIVTHGGTVGSALNALIAGLDSGHAYLNIHTTTTPTGELRALLTPVPEPATYAMFAAGLGLLTTVRRRRPTA